MPQYFVVTTKQSDINAYISAPPEGFDDKYLFFKNVPLSDRWPTDVSVRFSDAHREGLKLTDALANSYGFDLVNDALKGAIEASGAAVEFLPLRVLNHKGRVASERYWAVNVLLHLAAVDRERSEFVVHAFYEDQMDRFTRLVLNEDVKAEGPVLFRLQERPRLLLMREDLVEQITEQGLTGLRFVSVEQYSAI